MTVLDQKRRKILDLRRALDAATDDFLKFIDANPAYSDARQAAIEIIQRETADHFRLPISCMASKRKTAEITLPRQIAMSICRDVGKRTFKEIGDAFGGKDHGTAIHAVKSVGDRLATDPHFKAEYLSLRKRCENLVDNIDTPLFAVGT